MITPVQSLMNYKFSCVFKSIEGALNDNYQYLTCHLKEMGEVELVGPGECEFVFQDDDYGLVLKSLLTFKNSGCSEVTITHFDASDNIVRDFKLVDFNVKSIKTGKRRYDSMAGANLVMALTYKGVEFVNLPQ